MNFEKLTSSKYYDIYLLKFCKPYKRILSTDWLFDQGVNYHIFDQGVNSIPLFKELYIVV